MLAVAGHAAADARQPGVACGRTIGREDLDGAAEADMHLGVHRTSNSCGSISVSAPSRDAKEVVELVQGIAAVGAVGPVGDDKGLVRLDVHQAERAGAGVSSDGGGGGGAIVKPP